LATRGRSAIDGLRPDLLCADPAWSHACGTPACSLRPVRDALVPSGVRVWHRATSHASAAAARPVLLAIHCNQWGGERTARTRGTDPVLMLPSLAVSETTTNRAAHSSARGLAP